uniref:hypothetical protein n=1 Tax=Pseudodesulfovibrio sp. TaxID=2035812 RepID=UPI00257BDE4B|nr:hypothetical protein [Pseudodesulfovibrio sp.]
MGENFNATHAITATYHGTIALKTVKKLTVFQQLGAMAEVLSPIAKNLTWPERKGRLVRVLAYS